ncbi:MAG: hypothetical protein BroJett015_01960 [Chloroflexota bacterium]|nr:MAG: hypothetical protein BroJett015_01960 [Chloroflexota bacterium]
MNIPEKEQGQGLVEYALLLALIALIVLAILTLLGTQVVLGFARVAGGLNGDVLDVANGDRAVLVSYEGGPSGSGACSGSISNLRFVGVNMDGSVITNGAVTATLVVSGQPQGSVSGTAGSNGLATSSGSYSVSGICPLKITLE